MDILTSTSNPFIKYVRSLRQKKNRAETGSFLVEGIAHVGEVLQAGWSVDALVYAPALLTSVFAKDMLQHAERTGVKLQPVSVPVIETLVDKENPQGILGVVKQKDFRLTDLMQIKRVVALVSPQDPGNLGTILRTLDAVDADALLVLEGGVELYHPTVIRASMGALFWKPVIRTSFEDFIGWARKGGFQLIGTSAKADVDYHTLVPQMPWVLLLGNEQKGLSAEQTAACDVTISLPMRGRVSSLNLSVAAGVLLYQFMRAG